MFLFAHVFAGALLGLVFWHLTNDRRAVLVCCAGSLVPDGIDKSLGLLFPVVLGSGRTVFHALGLVLVLLICVLTVLRSDLRRLGVGAAGAVLLHQVSDEMWDLPSAWFYPFFGPFKGSMIPDYLLTYFWREITNPSEWMFMAGSVVIVAEMYRCRPVLSLPPVPDRVKTCAWWARTVVFSGTGIYLVAAGLTSTAAPFITPAYGHAANVMAGGLALSGAVVPWWKNRVTSTTSCSPAA